MSSKIEMSRDLAELLYRALNGGDQQLSGMEHGAAFRELRALLAAPSCSICNDTGRVHEEGCDPGDCARCAAPVVERQPVVIYMHTDELALFTSEDVSGGVAAVSKRPGDGMTALYTAPPELAELQATVASLRAELSGLSDINAYATTPLRDRTAQRKELQATIDQLRNDLEGTRLLAADQLLKIKHQRTEIERLKGGQGEPVAGESDEYVITNAGTLAALKAARQFIVNGTALGFIRMPDADTPDPAHDTLPMIERAIAELEAKPDGPLTNEGTIPAVIGTVVGGDCSHNTVTVQVIGDVPSELWTMGEAVTLTHGHLAATTDINDVLADHNRLVRELDVLLNGAAGAAEQASLCDIVAQVRMARKKPGSGPLQLLALVPDQVVGRVYHDPLPVRAYINEAGRALADGAPLYARPADTLMRYVRAPSREDPKYHEVWPEIEGGPVFDGVTYCKDLFEALKRYHVIVAETLPEGAVDEQ